MKRSCWFPLFLLLASSLAFGREAKLVRYPDYHQGRIAFTYLADIWTADEDGRNLQRITVHKARDVYPRFSPDGKWIAFSSERNGNLDVYIVPAAGGTARQLTFHSGDDSVLDWTSDSSAVLFASNRGEHFMGRLYTIGIEGGMPRDAGPDFGVYAGYSPDGRKLAVNRRSQSYWRKYYRGSYQTDVTVMDIASRTFTDLTDFDGMDTWPMWGSDGYIYFVSDREEGGLTNIWRVSEKAGKAEQVTTFKSGDVRWPAISSDRKTVVFEHDFGIWKLDLASRKVTPIRLDISAETQENSTDVRDFNSQVDDYDLHPAGRRIAFSIHGEVFTAPVEAGGDLNQLTESPWRDRDVVYSPDGKSIAFVSDRSGREEIYTIAVDGVGEPAKLTDLDALKLSFAWSQDSKEIAFVSSDAKLRKVNVESKQALDLASSTFGSIGAPVWSPDGKWIAYSKPDHMRTSDIYLIPSSGGQERKVTFDSYNDSNPRFTPDGRKLYFVRSEGSNFANQSAQIYSITLERLEKDPDDPEDRPESDVEGEGAGREGLGREGRRGGAAAQPPREIQIEWTGLKRRTRQVTRMPFPTFTYAIAPDSKTIVFTVSEPAGQRSTPVIYSIQEDGRRLNRIVSGSARGDDDEPGPPGGGFGFGGGISTLRFSRDGRALFYREGTGVYSVSMPAAGGGGGGAGGATGSPRGPGSDAARRPVSFTARVRVDNPAEWSQMFDDAWRTMKYRFYDTKMHERDWDAMRAKYRPLVEHVGDRQELLNIVNEMIGELNASHTGAAPAGGGQGQGRRGVATGHLGIDLEPDTQAGRYKVTHIYEEGPADKDWVRVSAGDYLIAINDKPVRAGDNFWPLLSYRLNRKVEVTFNKTPSEQGAWTTRIEPTSTFSQLRYERWVKQRREIVEKASGGRIGYLHIQAMNQPSLRRFEKELRENRGKEALVIDQRWNGGGNIDQELLGILVQRQYQVWQPRGTEASARPFSGFFGPKVVLQNWRSASNAEMFPAGFRALGLGKVIGTPTMGAVIGTGSYSLIDGSTVRTPGVGVFLADQKRTNMENYGVRPDILVENTPEDNLAGRDRQLEVAIETLMKEINGARKP